MYFKQHENPQDWEYSEVNIIPPPKEFSDYTEKAEDKMIRKVNESDAPVWVSPHADQEITIRTENKNLPEVGTNDISAVADKNYNFPHLTYNSALKVLRKNTQIVNHKITNIIIEAQEEHVIARILMLISLQKLLARHRIKNPRPFVKS